jgi:hypothetical protein
LTGPEGRFHAETRPEREKGERTMPVILWLLGVPLGLVIVLMLLGIV